MPRTVSDIALLSRNPFVGFLLVSQDTYCTFHVRMTIPCVISTKPSMQWVKTHGYLVWRSGFRDMECNIQCWTITFVQEMDVSLASRASLVKLLFFRLPETHGDNRKVPISTRSLF